MKANKIIQLPKIYLNEDGKYPQHFGKPKVSYSQLGSFKDYTMGYIRDYILNMKAAEDGIFADYGKMVGEYISDNKRHEYLDDYDVSVIKTVNIQKDAKYESEIVIDRGHYVIQGFSDLEYKVDDLLYIVDFKTGNSDEMLKKYGDLDKYHQTRLYAYQRENEGFKIGGCKVVHFGRKGNTLERGVIHKNTGNRLDIRMSGLVHDIETPYVRQDIENYLLKVDEQVLEISEYFRVFNENFAENKIKTKKQLCIK